MLKKYQLSKRKIIITSTLIIFLSGIGSYLYHTWHKPLGPSLNLTETSENRERTAGNSEDKTDSALKPVCGGPSSMMILVAGVGSDNLSSGPADDIRLVRLDFQKKKVSVLALSPDLWVNIPAIAEHGIEKGRLNQAYLFGTEEVGFYDSRGRGAELLARTLQKNFGLEPDHYLAFDLKVFRKIVDKVGGIEVNFSRNLDLKLSGEPVMSIQTGRRHLNGRQAEIVVRARIKKDDYSRLDNQTLVLRALADKTLTPNNLKELPNLVNLVLDRISTDFSPAEIKKLICLARKIDPARDITYLNLPREILTRKQIKDEFLERKVQAYTWEPEDIRRLIADFQAGKLPNNPGNNP
ncbi:MAG: LCP family protein [Desulfobia sp.]